MENEPAPKPRRPAPLWAKVFIVTGVVLAIAFIALHLAGRGLPHWGHR